MIFKYGLPVFTPLAILVLLVWGPAVLDDVVFAFMNMLISSLALAFMGRGDLPFSRKYGGAAERQRGPSGIKIQCQNNPGQFPSFDINRHRNIIIAKDADL